MNSPAKDTKDSKDAKQARKTAEETGKGTPDVAALTDDELKALIAVAEQELVTRKEKKRSEFFASIREQARALGFDPAEVAAALGKKGKRSATDRRSSVEPKYNHPTDPTITWAGRGAKPPWAREWEAAHGNLDGLKIKKPTKA